jgi:hypothetical protein
MQTMDPHTGAYFLRACDVYRQSHITHLAHLSQHDSMRSPHFYPFDTALQMFFVQKGVYNVEQRRPCAQCIRPFGRSALHTPKKPRKYIFSLKRKNQTKQSFTKIFFFVRRIGFMHRAIDLVQETKAALAKRGVLITTADESLCNHIITLHQPHCKYWAAIPSALLYVQHCLNHLGMAAFCCADIVLLHDYAQRSGGHLPRSSADLLHFWNTGKIPTSNLENLSPCRLVTEHVCSICFGSILSGQHVFTLQCGHVFHTKAPSADVKCDLLAWLRKTNSCPQCNEIVTISASPVVAAKTITTALTT